MGNIFFTSDTHFGHKRIIELCDRPFDDITHMNEMLVYNWNSVVSVEDTVYHLGDVALGPIEDSLKYISRLNGNKILIVGNHDRMFPPMAKNRPEKIAEWERRYIDAGFVTIVPDEEARVFADGIAFELSHFPYSGDSHGEERYREFRKIDNGRALIHGHTHQNKRFSLSKNGTPQVHVGVDAWAFTPVSLAQVVETLEEEDI